MLKPGSSCRQLAGQLRAVTACRGLGTAGFWCCGYQAPAEIRALRGRLPLLRRASQPSACAHVPHTPHAARATLALHSSLLISQLHMAQLTPRPRQRCAGELLGATARRWNRPRRQLWLPRRRRPKTRAQPARAIARARRLGRQALDVDEAVPWPCVAVYGATTATPRAPPPPSFGFDGTKPGRRGAGTCPPSSVCHLPGAQRMNLSAYAATSALPSSTSRKRAWCPVDAASVAVTRGLAPSFVAARSRSILE